MVVPDTIDCILAVCSRYITALHSSPVPAAAFILLGIAISIRVSRNLGCD